MKNFDIRLLPKMQVFRQKLFKASFIYLYPFTFVLLCENDCSKILFKSGPASSMMGEFLSIVCKHRYLSHRGRSCADNIPFVLASCPNSSITLQYISIVVCPSVSVTFLNLDLLLSSREFQLMLVELDGSSPPAIKNPQDEKSQNFLVLQQYLE